MTLDIARRLIDSVLAKASALGLKPIAAAVFEARGAFRRL